MLAECLIDIPFSHEILLGWVNKKIDSPASRFESDFFLLYSLAWMNPDLPDWEQADFIMVQ